MHRRRLEDINDRSRTAAIGTWMLEAGFVGLGGGKTESKPTDFLPFKIADPNDPTERLKQNLSQETIEIFRELVNGGEIPAHIVRDFWLVEGLQELVLQD